MTTMNYPAQFSAISSDEMVYLDGGTLLSEAYDDMKTVNTWVNGLYYPFQAIYNLTAGAVTVEKGITSLSKLASAVASITYGIRYIALATTSWINMGVLPDVEF